MNHGDRGIIGRDNNDASDNGEDSYYSDGHNNHGHPVKD